MFRDVPECSGMFHVPGFIDAPVFACPYENAKQWKYDTISRKACVMLAVTDALRHRIRKLPFLSVHVHVNEWPAFSKIFTLESVFEKMRNSVIVDGRRNRREKNSFSNKNG